MKIRSATFLTSSTGLESCPSSPWREFAFIGRSNVGKSSLLNLIVGNQGLAKVSATPGHTQLINFFSINNAWSLVDLPGYGYAKTRRAGDFAFEEMISGYLSKRPNLARVFVLIDSRHTPQTIDLEFVQWLAGHQVPFALVFTKIDKTKPKQLQTNVALFQEQLAAMEIAGAEVFLTSAETKSGRGELLGFIERTLALGTLASGSSD